jgi:hypothetical protein
LLAGDFLDAGEVGVTGKGFLLNGIENLHESFWIGMFWIAPPDGFG